ncbi:hypothetical protein BJ912DRAFT_127525 [Pholiota molesta]|nr:hypothetical protein BJ912DRAFT_127525 [Pholiota molesta]
MVHIWPSVTVVISCLVDFTQIQGAYCWARASTRVRVRSWLQRSLRIRSQMCSISGIKELRVHEETDNNGAFGYSVM